MTDPISAIRAELELLRPKVGCLEQAEALLVPLYESLRPATGIERQGRSRASAPRRRRSGRRRNPIRPQVRDYVAVHGPVARRDVIAGLGGHPKAISSHLRQLLADGEIAADGPSGARRYHSATTPVTTRGPRSLSSPTTSTPPQPEPGVYPVYDCIAELGGATTTDIVARTALPPTVIHEQGRRLIRLGYVEIVGVGAGRVWRPRLNVDG